MRASAASGVCDILRHIGAEPEDVLRHADVREEDLAAPLSWLRLDNYCDLLELVANYSETPCFGLKLGFERPLGLLGDIGDLATSSPTVYSALEEITENFWFVQDHTEVTLQHVDERLVISYQIRNGHIVQRRQDAELTIGALIGVIRLSLGPYWAPDEIHFEHARPKHTGEHETLIGAPVYFGQPRNAIIMHSGGIGSQTPSFNPRRYAELRQCIAGRRTPQTDVDFVGVVLQEIRDRLALGTSSAENIARKLGMSAPSLYRRLKACGVEFSDLQRDLRRELALGYVGEAHLPLTEIAFILGYSELSAFSRAFSTWTGVSPNVYRQTKSRNSHLIFE